MTRATRQTHPNARLDASIALPLGRFREALSGLSLDELTMLQRRIGTRLVAARWARGGHGVVRHQAVNELGRLGRRELAIGHELETRRAAPAAIRVLRPHAAVPVDEERAA